MTYKNKRKANFRPSEATSLVRDRITSANEMRILVSILLLISVACNAQQFMTASTIKDVVNEEFRQEVTNRASHSGWHDYSLDANIRVPSAANHLPLCPTKLVVSGVDNKTLPVGNVKRSVNCVSPTVNWRINVAIKSALTLDVVVAKSGINRDEAITASRITMEPRTIRREQSFFTELSQVSHKTAIRRIRSGQIIDSRQLDTPGLVVKGNHVVIIASKDGFTASTKGIALEAGTYEQQIDVQNIASGKVIKAVVIGLNRVQTQF